MGFTGFVALVLAVYALHQVVRLSRQIQSLEDRLAAFMAAAAAHAAEPEAAVPEPPAAAEASRETPLPMPETIGATVAATVSGDILDTPPPAPAPGRGADREQSRAARWFVGRGGLAFAIGGLLFGKGPHDVGLIPPVLRVAVGLAFGGALVRAGEALRQRSSFAAQFSDRPDYVPPALTAAGLLILFGVIYAAYGLYDLVPPLVAFIGLAAVALFAMVLSQRQGWFIAALGLLGAYAAPTLIPSPDPSAWSFFPYLLIILAAALLILQRQNWWWLGYSAIVGSLFWALLWTGGAVMERADTLPIGLFAMALGGLSVFLLKGMGIFEEDSGSLLHADRLSQPLAIATLGMAAGGTILAYLVHRSDHNALSLALFALGMAGISAFSWLKRGYSAAMIAAALVSLIVLMAWRDVSLWRWAMDESGLWSLVPGLDAPPRFFRWMMAAMLAFMALGAMGLVRRSPKYLWAVLMAGAAVTYLIGAWSRAEFLWRDVTWAVFAVLLSGALKGMLFTLRGRFAEGDNDRAGGALLLGMAALSLFAADRLFNGLWLTLAIAALALAFAWGVTWFNVRLIGPIAAGLGTLAAAKLFLARELGQSYSGLPWGDHWVLYGYGLPALAFWLGSRILRRHAQLRSAMALEGLSLGLGIALVSLEIRTLIGGVSAEMTLLELSAHVLAWLGAAYGLLYREAVFSSVISRWGSRALLAASVAAIVLGSLMLLNPVITRDLLPGSFLFNPLLLAYLAPVPLMALIARKLGGGWLRNGVGLLAVALAFAYVTLETKRLFQGPILHLEAQTDGEFYAYSLVWLAFALALFMAGLKLARQNVRYAGLAVMTLVVLKVFLADMADLSGLLRIFSFMGLGASLVGIGWLYTRFLPPPAPEPYGGAGDAASVPPGAAPEPPPAVSPPRTTSRAWDRVRRKS